MAVWLNHVRSVVITTVSMFVLVTALAGVAPAQDRVQQLLRSRSLALSSQVTAIDTQVNSLNLRMPAVDQEIERLSEEVRNLKVPDPEEEDEEQRKPPPRQVPFRPPLEREVDKQTPIALICKNDRVAILDLAVEANEFSKLLVDQVRVQQLVDTRTATIPAGEVDVVITVLELRGNNATISKQVELSSGREGVPLPEALRPNSSILRRLGELRSERDVIQFAVYPDSFAVFRGVREEVWKRKFGVQWVPIPHGEKIGVGSGPITEQ